MISWKITKMLPLVGLSWLWLASCCVARIRPIKNCTDAIYSSFLTSPTTMSESQMFKVIINPKSKIRHVWHNYESFVLTVQVTAAWCYRLNADSSSLSYWALSSNDSLQTVKHGASPHKCEKLHILRKAILIRGGCFFILFEKNLVWEQLCWAMEDKIYSSRLSLLLGSETITSNTGGLPIVKDFHAFSDISKPIFEWMLLFSSWHKSLVLPLSLIRFGNEHPSEHGGWPVWHDWSSNFHPRR